MDLDRKSAPEVLRTHTADNDLVGIECSSGHPDTLERNEFYDLVDIGSPRRGSLEIMKVPTLTRVPRTRDSSVTRKQAAAAALSGQ